MNVNITTKPYMIGLGGAGVAIAAGLSANIIPIKHKNIFETLPIINTALNADYITDEKVCKVAVGKVKRNKSKCKVSKLTRKRNRSEK